MKLETMYRILLPSWLLLKLILKTLAIDLDVFFFKFLVNLGYFFSMKDPLYRSKLGENLPVKETLEGP
jgi:hypothetical protein